LKRVSHAIGLRELEATYDEVADLRDNSLSSRLIHLSIRLDGTRREAPFCFEDAKLKIRVAAAQFDEFGFLIVFPLKAGGWGRVEFGSRPIALSKAICERQEAHCGA
jgi:hypothetical protein